MAHMVKNLPAMQETCVGKIPSRREKLPTPVFLPGDSMDRGAWQATVRRVTKSQKDLYNKRASVGEDDFGFLSSPVAGNVLTQSKLKSGTYITKKRKPSLQGLHQS